MTLQDRPSATLQSGRSMIRLLALCGYFYQSITAVLLILILSHILAPASYTTFSLTIAVSQLVTVIAFEWLQLAGQRFLASSQGDESTRLRSSMFSAFALSILALASLVGLATVVTDLPPTLTGLGLAITILQGTTELHYMVIRVVGGLAASSLLLISRATFLLVGAVAGAKLVGTAEAALLGTLTGHGLGLVLGSIVDHTLIRWSPRRTTAADLAAFARYGMLASGASVVHLSAPILIRFLVIGRLGIASDASAGFSMALDLLQRPFSVLLSAIHTICYPDVVSRFDNGTRQEAQRRATELFDLALSSTALMLGGLIAFIPDAARYFVPPALMPAFIAVTPSVAAFYFLHTHLQATLALVPHLQKAALRLIIIAAAQLALISLFVFASTLAGMSPTAALTSAAVATGLMILFASWPTIRFGAYPSAGPVAAAIVGATIIGSFTLMPSAPLDWLIGKIFAAGAISLLVAWYGDLLRHH
jgi:O-antigen/teichoic acid export membrane protein